MNLTLNSSRHRFLASKTFSLFLLFLYLSDSTSAQELSKEPENFNLREIASLSIQLNKKTIQASSLQDQLFPMLVSSKIDKISETAFSRNPVDLVCVFEIENERYCGSSFSLHAQVKEIQNLFKNLLPLMTDQDRLSIVLFYDPSSPDLFSDAIDMLSITELFPLTSTTTQNWETILMNIGEKIVREGLSTERALKAAMKILSQRSETNRTTGVFISKPESHEWHSEFIEDRKMHEIELIKEELGLQDKNWIIQTFEGSPKEQSEVFGESLAALRAGIIETRILLKLEESELLKGVEIQSPYFMFLPVGTRSFSAETFPMRSPGLKSGFEEFCFDLKIPRITKDLPSSPMEVKIASYQVIFVLEDGSEVVKSEDLVVRIVEEGEKFVEEEESEEIVRDFYRKWGKDWLLPTAIYTHRANYENAKGLLKRYKESLEGSIVKDDEMIQSMCREAERKID